MTSSRPTPILLLLCLAAIVAVPAGAFDYYEMDSSTLRKMLYIRIVPPGSLPVGTVTVIGMIEGTYCREDEAGHSRSQHREDMAYAIEQVKMSAALEGADLIEFPQCNSRTSTTIINNGCYALTTCRGKALKFLNPAI